MRGLVFLLLVALASAKVFERCELAEELRRQGMGGYRNTSLADWVCIAWRESRYNTQAINSKNRNRSTDYGIFQINNRHWCNDGTSTDKACGIPCSDLLTDNITAAITCAKRVMRDPKGIAAWMAWGNCEKENRTRYVAGCRFDN